MSSTAFIGPRMRASSIRRDQAWGHRLPNGSQPSMAALCPRKAKWGPEPLSCCIFQRVIAYDIAAFTRRGHPESSLRRIAMSWPCMACCISNFQFGKWKSIDPRIQRAPNNGYRSTTLRHHDLRCDSAAFADGFVKRSRLHDTNSGR